MLEQGIRLLIRFCQDDCIRVAQPTATCRSSSHDRSGKMILSPTLMALENSTVSAACWNGKHLQAATRNSRGDCWRSIRSWFATRGSLASQRLLRSFLCGSGWSRFNTCELRSTRSSLKSSAISSKKQSAELSPRSSCLTAESASRRTPARPVHTWDCVWGDRK